MTSILACFWLLAPHLSVTLGLNTHISTLDSRLSTIHRHPTTLYITRASYELNIVSCSLENILISYTQSRCILSCLSLLRLLNPNLLYNSGTSTNPNNSKCSKKPSEMQTKANKTETQTEMQTNAK